MTIVMSWLTIRHRYTENVSLAHLLHGRKPRTPSRGDAEQLPFHCLRRILGIPWREMITHSRPGESTASQSVLFHEAAMSPLAGRMDDGQLPKDKHGTVIREQAKGNPS